MKKITFALALILTLLCIIPSVAMANPIEMVSNEEVSAVIKDIPQVRDCEVEVFGKTVFIAIRTKGITTKSDSDKLIATVVSTVKEKYNNFENVFVSTSIKAFKTLERFDKNQAIKELLEIFDVDISTLPLPKNKNLPYKGKNRDEIQTLPKIEKSNDQVEQNKTNENN